MYEKSFHFVSIVQHFSFERQEPTPKSDQVADLLPSGELFHYD